MGDRKGVSIISEVILAIGIIGVAILFSLVATDIIDFSRGSFTGSAQQGMLEDISFRIDTITSSSGETRFTYNPTFSQYTLETRENRTLEIQLEGEETQSATFHAVRLRDTFIEGSEAICIHGNSREIAIDPGNCSSSGLTDICEDGCDLQECRPDLGADCTTPACTYPEDAESPDASEYCDPAYDPDYISGENSTVGIGWVNQSFVGSQGEGDQCTESFECTGSMECSQSAPSGPSGSYCCPSGLSYAGPSEGCTYVNRFHLVFVPLQYNSGEEDEFEDWVENEYLPLWLDDLPVSRSDIKVDIIAPSDVDNSAVGSSGDGDCPSSDINLAVAEANAHVSGNYDHAVGIYKETSQCGLAACGAYESQSISQGSVSASANPSLGWGPAVAAQEVAHNWGFNHIPPYECSTTCGGQRKYGCPTGHTSDYMQNSPGVMNDYFGQAEDCIKELFKAEGWANLPDFSQSDSSCDIHVIS